jgi:hypothetical protein
VELAVGIDVTLRRSHVGGLRELAQSVGGQKGFVFHAFELQRIRTGLDDPPVFADGPDGAAHPRRRFDDSDLLAGAHHGVGDGQSGRSRSENDGVEHHGSSSDAEDRIGNPTSRRLS